MSVTKTGPFINTSRENGWKFYASVAPPSGKSTQSGDVQEHIFTADLASPLNEHPCVLMLGGEGTGLKPDLQRKADYLISIAGQRGGHGGVDSLNVSVAAGLLCETFLRQPLKGLGISAVEALPEIDGSGTEHNQRDLF